LERIEQQIVSLQDYLYEVELYPEQTKPWAKLRRAVSLFLVRRHVLRQLQQLFLRKRVIHNCHLYIHKKEPERPPIPENAGPVRARRP
ncbi:MAG: hypothetical protein WA990_00135, partial [Rubrobacteraceae bacterium]